MKEKIKLFESLLKTKETKTFFKILSFLFEQDLIRQTLEIIDLKENVIEEITKSSDDISVFKIKYKEQEHLVMKWPFQACTCLSIDVNGKKYTEELPLCQHVLSLSLLNSLFIVQL